MSENTPEPRVLDELDDPAEAAPEERDLEAPEADAAEQRAEVREASGEAAAPPPLEADPLDAADQRRVVEIDEDDYR